MRGGEPHRDCRLAKAWSRLISAGRKVIKSSTAIWLASLPAFVCACLLFVISCERLGVVRRHLTRAQFYRHTPLRAERIAPMQYCDGCGGIRLGIY
jgi:hypothetical protein